MKRVRAAFDQLVRGYATGEGDEIPVSVKIALGQIGNGFYRASVDDALKFTQRDRVLRGGVCHRRSKDETERTQGPRQDQRGSWR